METMKIDVFGKKRQTADGKKSFYTYFATLTKKTGETVSVEVKFREECGNPKNVPCTIEVEKKDVNYSEKMETFKDAETLEERETLRRRLWVSRFKETEYVDTSMDEFI